MKISINEPCHENWDKMTAANQGRFCNACSKVVVDFSMMSDKEILNHISKASSSICGRVNNDQLNRPIQLPTERRQISFRYFWSLLISSFLIGSKANAQGKVRVDTITNTNPKLVGDTVLVAGGIMSVAIEDDGFFTDHKLISGQVTDEAGNAIPFASVKIENSKYGKVADSKGRFKFKIPSNDSYSTLLVTSIGYESVSIDLNKQSQADLNIVMAGSQKELLEGVVVVAYPTISCSGMAGGISIGVSVSENRIQTLWNDLVGKNEIKIFPNPVRPATAFNISFNVAEIGNYKLELYDASGRLMHTASIPILSKKHVMSFGRGLSLTPGIYFVKILSARGKNVYSGSLLVQ